MASKWKAGILAGALMLSLMPGTYAAPKDGRNSNEDRGEGKFRHVLLLSIDGMHALDFENCANGISTINGGLSYCPNLADLNEHGGFAPDDTNVMMLLSNPSFAQKTVKGPVETAQLAPTILQALGLDPSDLQAVRKDGTTVLPGLSLGEGH